MQRLSAIAFCLCLSWVSVFAADDSIQAYREYTDRLLTMDGTAASHVALAKWCEGRGLADRARLHWQEALACDADNKEARAALGYVRRGTQWVIAADAAAPGSTATALPAAPPADPTFVKRRQALLQEILNVSNTYLNSMDPRVWEEGRRQILMIRDPAAAEPISRILGAGDQEKRRLACEALGAIPGDEAARRLVKFVLADESPEVYGSAVAALAARTDERGLPQLLNALNGSEKVMQRAAKALGEMGEYRAVPALIAHLKTPEPRIRVYEAQPGAGGMSPGPSAYMAIGEIITYVADVEPVVAEGAVAWNPKIGTIPVGTVLSVHNPRVTIHRTVIELVRQPVVREALKKITGKDFEYDTQAWRDWYERRQSDRPVHAELTN